MRQQSQKGRRPGPTAEMQPDPGAGSHSPQLPGEQHPSVHGPECSVVLTTEAE